MNERINILDCTLRDGGYYNNWEFSNNDIKNYLMRINQTKINYIEIGMRFTDNNKSFGLTGTTEDSLLKKVSSYINDDKKIGLMINASDFLKNDKVNLILAKTKFKNFQNINFIRIACKFNEIKKIKKLIKFFQRKKKILAINIMQISEINNNDIEKIFKFLVINGIKYIYIADSLGCLQISKLKSICSILKKFKNINFGIHAHDNLRLALKNTIFAKNHGFNFIDSTLMGMGRGAGNTKTEEIYPVIFPNDTSGIKNIKIINSRLFKPLLRKYNWGSNKFYAFAAKKKIHPTYVQEMLSDNRFTKRKIFLILKELSKLDAKKYNFETIDNIQFKQSKKIKTFYPEFGDSILLLGSNNNITKTLKTVIKRDDLKNLKVMSINYKNSEIFKYQLKRNVDYLISCSLKRILTEYFNYKKSNTKLILPIKKLPREICSYLLKNKIKVYDFDFAKSDNYKIITKKKCELKNELTLAYSIILLLSFAVKKIYLAGFEKNNKKLSKLDESYYFFNSIKKYKEYNNIEIEHI